MPFSHHSHSGQFCGHAQNSLEEVILNAISKGMTTFCLTEHIPRRQIDFYPEEERDHTPETLAKLFDDFYGTARQLQKKYADQIQLFVGFEGEWIRDYSLSLIRDLLSKYPVDLFVGSVHHVHTIPIDYDITLYRKARDLAGGTDKAIFNDYFDAQAAMLQALKPPVVGHFDLIRLMSDDANRSFRTWDDVWQRVLRNLKLVAAYGGVLELNSSALRKGMAEAYPQVEICKEFVAQGGRFTISDDSHGIDQVGLNYGKVLQCTKDAGISEIQCLAAISDEVRPLDDRFPGTGWKSVHVSELGKHSFWTRSC